MLGFLIIAAIIALVIFWVVGIYNGLVRLRVGAENAWSDIDVQLKRRYELIPNLVETVKGYATHEKQTFEQVTAARTRAMAAQGPVEKAQAEGMLTSALKTLFAVAEAYPELRAAENFQQLQKTLSQLEEYIQSARRYYNAVVRDLNTKIQQFPSNMIARQFGFTEREFFELDEASERVVPKVSFNSGA